MSKFKVGDKVISKDGCSLAFVNMIESSSILTIEEITSQINEIGELKHFLHFKEGGKPFGFIETKFELFNQLNTKLGELW